MIQRKTRSIWHPSAPSPGLFHQTTGPSLDSTCSWNKDKSPPAALKTLPDPFPADFSSLISHYLLHQTLKLPTLPPAMVVLLFPLPETLFSFLLPLGVSYTQPLWPCSSLTSSRKPSQTRRVGQTRLHRRLNHRASFSLCFSQQQNHSCWSYLLWSLESCLLPSGK